MTSWMLAGKRSDLPLSKGFGNSLDDFFGGGGSSSTKSSVILPFTFPSYTISLPVGRLPPCRAVLQWPNNSCHFGGEKREHQQSEERSSDWLPSPLPSHRSREDAQVTASQLWEARGDNQAAKGRDMDTHGITDKGGSNTTGTYFFPFFTFGLTRYYFCMHSTKNHSYFRFKEVVKSTALIWIMHYLNAELPYYQFVPCCCTISTFPWCSQRCSPYVT